MQKLRTALLVAASLFGLLIAARALLGPLSFPVSIRTPINIESICGFLIMVLFLLPAREGVSNSPSVKPIWALLLVTLAVAGFWRALNVYFLADDFVLVTRANDFNLGKMRELWTTAEAAAFFRPMILFTMAGTAQWAHFDPGLWRLNSVLLHGVNSALVFALAARLGLSRNAALFAGALFAVHGCLPESVVWIAGWFGTLSTLFFLCALVLFLEHLARQGHGHLWFGVASFACMTLALLSKETAYVFPLVAALAAWDRGALRRAWPTLATFFGGSLVVFAYRWTLLGGIGGYVDLNAGGPLLMKLGIVPVLRSLLLRLWAVLVFPINWSREPELWLGLITAGYVAALVWLASSCGKSRSLWFPAGFVLLGALPPLEQLLIGPDLQKSRELYLPLAGFCVLLAGAADRLHSRVRWVVPAMIIGFNFVALQHNITIWRNVGNLAQQTCVAASRCSTARKLRIEDVPGSLDGVYFLGVGLPECVGIATHSAPPEIESGSDLAWDAGARELRCNIGR
jgi:hypothetical protein